MRCEECDAVLRFNESCPCGVTLDGWTGRPYRWVPCPSCRGRGSYQTGCDYCRECGGVGGYRQNLQPEAAE